MKKVLTMLAVGALVASASADLTGFQWGGGAADNVPSGANVLSLADGASFYSVLSVGTTTDYVISLADLSAFVADSVNSKDVLLAFQGGTWGIQDAVVGTGSWAGFTPACVVSDVSALSELALGDVFDLATAVTALVELQSDPALPANSQQSLVPSDLSTVQVVPEPATVGLMGIAGLAMFLARKKSRR
jgi:hypothetical protein